jgi:acetoin utilization deacetylase AcuC-like enzyme
MRVVYTPQHLSHDIASETTMGLPIPANEVGERAERIRATLEADGGFTLQDPETHGAEPITAVHDPGLLRFLAEAWPQARREAIGRTAHIPEAFAARAYFEEMRIARQPGDLRSRRVLGLRVHTDRRRDLIAARAQWTSP